MIVNWFTFPFLFWSAVFNVMSGSSSGYTTALTRHKKQETMRRHPDWFDADGNFTGIPEKK